MFVSTALLVGSVALPLSVSQDPSAIAERLAAETHRFRIEEGELVGDGAAFLRREIVAARFVLLGEYHGSQRIGELTRALIPILHGAGCRHLALEVGPTSVLVLDELAGDGSRTVEALRGFNTEASVEGPTRIYPAIPFFEGVADAEFLAEAAGRDWQLIGFDQEFGYGLIPVLERMVRNRDDELPEGLAEAAFEAVADAYELERTQDCRVSVTLSESAELADFLVAAAQDHPVNARIADDLRTSIEIYRLNAVGDWWASNGMRIRHMKDNLARGFDATGFDVWRDRLLVKVGGVHSGRGLSLLRHYEIGNTLSELAELHGAHSLHLEFSSRYWKEDEGVVDELESDPRYEVVRELGRADEWTVVDLRPLKKAVFYDRLELERFTKEWFLQHDLIVIPPADESPVPNRD